MRIDDPQIRRISNPTDARHVPHSVLRKYFIPDITGTHPHVEQNAIYMVVRTKMINLRTLCITTRMGSDRNRMTNRVLAIAMTIPSRFKVRTASEITRNGEPESQCRVIRRSRSSRVDGRCIDMYLRRNCDTTLKELIGITSLSGKKCVFGPANSESRIPRDEHSEDIPLISRVSLLQEDSCEAVCPEV